MLKKMLILSALTVAMSSVWAADQERAQDQTQARIYGSQLMTPQERAEYRSRMQAAKTAEERERIRNEHHEQMKVRARERGVSIPDEPPARGMMAPGGGMGGGGMGGGGMGGGGMGGGGMGGGGMGGGGMGGGGMGGGGR